MHYSRKYHNSPMPHSIFFHGGYAIHGTYATGSLGRCGLARLRAPVADPCRGLYAMVRAEGARISIVGSRPGRGDVQVARRRVAAPELVAYDDDGSRQVTRRHRHRRDRGNRLCQPAGLWRTGPRLRSRAPRRPELQRLDGESLRGGAARRLRPDTGLFGKSSPISGPVSRSALIARLSRRVVAGVMASGSTLRWRIDGQPGGCGPLEGRQRNPRSARRSRHARRRRAHRRRNPDCAAPCR